MVKKGTQCARVLDYLKQHGKLNSYDATFELRIKQAPARIMDLKRMGYKIRSVRQENRSVDWVLDELPQKERPFTWEIGEDDIARKVYS